MIHRQKKLSRFAIKSRVTCGIKIRHGKVGNWRIFESNWLDIKSLIDSTSTVESLIDSTLRVKLTQHWESNWLNIESQNHSTLRVKLTQLSLHDWEYNWLNIESQVESTWLKYSPVTHFARSNYNSASDSTFNVIMTQFTKNWVILT